MDNDIYSIIHIYFDKNLNLIFHVNNFIIIIFLIFCGIYSFIILKSLIKHNSIEIDEAKIGIGDQKIKLKINNLDRQIAYQIWVELNTRKIGLEFDENDVIIELYNSWYDFFKITRELIKSIPASKLNNKNTKQIIMTAIEVLNIGIRPHLTKWQAKFRRWYDLESKKESSKKLSPQTIQRKFPDIDILISEIRTVNQSMINYKNLMYDIIS
ncbi:hypothetical protein EHQ47_16845 [Leptospira bourretii]|uniref:hypothetical protein n=1 Tax=Leptospira bourretii TaxID=2484962 RepID=UPI0010911BFA|nr:hypothetical protein [Leptospira bourretii]TGL19764.1 hypothetical protein EHQ47_16845 [Leptospira bourretii]